MLSLLPSASRSQGQGIIARQNKPIQEVPEVESVVGKVGQSESALDHAPTSMIETIIILKPKIHWRMVHEERCHGGLSWLIWCTKPQYPFLSSHISKAVNSIYA